MKLKELQGLRGQRVTLQLAADAPGQPAVTGRVVGTIDAADGMVLTVEPDGAPGTRLTVHSHHVIAATPA